MQKQQYPGIPGLFLYPDFFSPDQCADLVQATLAVYVQFEHAVAGAPAGEKVHIPQPAFVRSARHNQASEELYTRIVLDEGERRPACEYFPRYGEDGHALAYFRGNGNLPAYVADGLISRIRSAMEEALLVQPEQNLTWKLTVNFYKNVGGTVVLPQSDLEERPVRASITQTEVFHEQAAS
jgi:hypothetical protein